MGLHTLKNTLSCLDAIPERDRRMNGQTDGQHCYISIASQQRDRAMLRVIEYSSNSLKVIRNDTLEQGVYALLVCHSNYICILYRFRDIQRQIMARP